MLKLILSKQLACLHVEKFLPKDYMTMCSLIKERYPVYNEAIELHKDVRLLDENNKLIGIYEASEARRKASNMKKDIILVNVKSSPAVCKVVSFREMTLRKFYDEIVNKRNEQLLKKASSTKQLKISSALNESELQIKARQIVELAKKNYNVRIYMNCKESQMESSLSKMELIKSMVQNKCSIERDVEAFQDQDDKDDDNEAQKEPRRSFAMVVKSRENQFMKLLSESSEKEPEVAIEAFLKRYYKQEDVEMRDLQATAELDTDQDQFASQAALSNKPKDANKDKIDSFFDEMTDEERDKILKQNAYEVREAKARILNERLRRILGSQ